MVHLREHQDERDRARSRRATVRPAVRAAPRPERSSRRAAPVRRDRKVPWRRRRRRRRDASLRRGGRASRGLGATPRAGPSGSRGPPSRAPRCSRGCQGAERTARRARRRTGRAWPLRPRTARSGPRTGAPGPWSRGATPTRRTAHGRPRGVPVRNEGHIAPLLTGSGAMTGPQTPSRARLRRLGRSPPIKQPAHERGLRGVDADGQHGAAVRDLHRGAGRIAEAEARRHGHRRACAVRAGRAARGVSCFTRRPLPGAAPAPRPPSAATLDRLRRRDADYGRHAPRPGLRGEGGRGTGQRDRPQNSVGRSGRLTPFADALPLESRDRSWPCAQLKTRPTLAARSAWVCWLRCRPRS